MSEVDKWIHPTDLESDFLLVFRPGHLVGDAEVLKRWAALLQAVEASYFANIASVVGNGQVVVTGD